VSLIYGYAIVDNKSLIQLFSPYC